MLDYKIINISDKKGKIILGISIAMVCVAALIAITLLVHHYLKRTRQHFSNKRQDVTKHQDEESFSDSSSIESFDGGLKSGSNNHHSVANPSDSSSIKSFDGDVESRPNSHHSVANPSDSSSIKSFDGGVEIGSHSHHIVVSNESTIGTPRQQKSVSGSSRNNPYLASIKKEKIDDFIESELSKVETSVEKYVRVDNQSYKAFLTLLYKSYKGLDNDCLGKMEDEVKKHFYLITNKNLINESLILATYLDMSATKVKYVILFGENCRDYLRSPQYKRDGMAGLASSVCGANEIFLKYVDLSNSLKPPRLMASFITMTNDVEQYFVGCLGKISKADFSSDENDAFDFLSSDLSKVKIFSEKALSVIAKLYVKIAYIQNSINMSNGLEKSLKRQLFIILVNLCELRRISDLLDSGLVLMSTIGTELSFFGKNTEYDGGPYPLPFGVGLGAAVNHTQSAFYSATFLQSSLASMVTGEKIKYFSWNEILENDVFGKHVKYSIKALGLNEETHQAILINIEHFVSNAIQKFWQVSVDKCNDADLIKMKTITTCGHVDYNLNKTSVSANINEGATAEIINVGRATNK